MRASVGELLDSIRDNGNKLFFPDLVEFVNFLIPLDAIKYKPIIEVLSCFRVLFSLHSLIFSFLISFFFRLVRAFRHRLW